MNKRDQSSLYSFYSMLITLYPMEEDATMRTLLHSISQRYLQDPPSYSFRFSYDSVEDSLLQMSLPCSVSLPSSLSMKPPPLLLKISFLFSVKY